MLSILKNKLYPKLENKLILYNIIVFSISFIASIVLFYVVGILLYGAIIVFMYFVKSKPGWNLEMGWMIFMILAVVLAVIMSVVFFIVLLVKNIKIRRNNEANNKLL